jgi:hypothetical protein
MGINVTWDDDQRRVIRWDFDLTWNSADFHYAVEWTTALRMGGTLSADLIINHPGNNLPTNIIALLDRTLRQLDETTRIVIVDPDPFVHTITATFQRLHRKSGQRLEVATTLEEARALLCERCPAAASS